MMRFEQAHMDAPIRTLVMESPVSIDKGRLQAVFTPDKIKPGSPASAALINLGEQHAREYALASMNDALDKRAGLDIINSPAEQSPIISEIGGMNFDSAITQDQADRLRAATGADALFRFGISDYGLTPKSWRDGYITFEITSTLAIAGAIAYTGSAAARAAAGAYLVQEGVEESAESYAGFWALDVVSRPVRIEARLVRLNPVATVWEASDTGLSDVRLSRLTRKVDSIEQNNQLDQSTAYAVNDLVSSLSAAMGKNDLPGSDRLVR
ncbi:MAG: hypothetical protein WCB93_03600 [Gallionella sp.]